MGRGLEDRNRAGASTGAGVVCRLGRGCLGLGPGVGSFNGTSLVAFPGLGGAGFRGLLLGLAFFVASDPVGFLLPVGAEPGARVGGTTVAGGRGVLVETGLGAGDGGKPVGWGGLCVLVRAGASSLARPLILASARTTGGKGFLEEPVVAGGRGRALGGGGLGVTGCLWIGFTVGRETLVGTGWEVGSFLVGGAGFVKEGGAAFRVGWGLLTGTVEGERAEGLAGWLLGIWVAVLFSTGWTGLVELAGEAGDMGGSSVVDSLEGGRGVWEGPSTVTGWCGPVVLVLKGLAGVAGTTVTLGPLPAGCDPRAGVALVRFSRPSRARSVWKVRGVPESRGRKGPSWGRYVSACPHCFLRWVQ